MTVPATRARPRAAWSVTPTVVSKPGSGAPVRRAWRMPRSSAMSSAFTRLTGSTLIPESRPSTAAISTGHVDREREIADEQRVAHRPADFDAHALLRLGRRGREVRRENHALELAER